MFSQPLKIGDKIKVQVVESIDKGYFIVNYSGSLIRVKNSSHLKLKVSQSVQLVVTALNPLSFSIENSPQRRHMNKFI
jgi:hypothetical protein